MVVYITSPICRERAFRSSLPFPPLTGIGPGQTIGAASRRQSFTLPMPDHGSMLMVVQSSAL